MTYSLEAILFAEDLMKYIFTKHRLNYIPRSKSGTGKYGVDNGLSPFRLIIGNAVCLAINDNSYELAFMFQQEFISKLSVPLFREHIMNLLPDWFPEGYHPLCFIEFCIMVCFMAISYYNAGYHEISSCASEVIAAILTRQMLKGEFKAKGGWEKLVKISTELVILDRQTKFELEK